MSVDFVQLTKLLMMTTSTNDNEALVAMRKANALLLSNKQTWMDIFKSGAPKSSGASGGGNGYYQHRRTETPPWADDVSSFDFDFDFDFDINPRAKAKPRGRSSGVSWNGKLVNDHEIEMMFVMALQNVRRGTSFYATLVQIREFWHEKGFVTQKQFDVVARAATQ